jgi:hypothetical protein
MTIHVDINPTMNFDTLPRATRASLLQGPTVLIVLSYSGTTQERTHQVDTAQGITTSERCKQLSDHHLHSPHNRYTIEMPQAALTAASSAFGTLLQSAQTQAPAETIIEIDFGSILPGYALEVVDWYVRSLRAEYWVDFPIVLSVAGLDYGGADRRDWWYYYYVYVAMRNLQLDLSITAPLQDFLVDKIERCGLCDGFDGLVQLLKHLGEHDPVVQCACQRHARLVLCGESAMDMMGYMEVVNLYPWFQDRIEGLVGELQSVQSADESGDEVDEMDDAYTVVFDVTEDEADGRECEAGFGDEIGGLVKGAKKTFVTAQSFYQVTTGVEGMGFGG